MNIPANLKYTNDDEWIRLEGEEAYVGITDYAQHELGAEFFLGVQGLTDDVGVDVDEGDVAKFMLCVIGDADVGFIALKADPFVVVGVLQVCRNIHFCLY